MTDVTKRPAEGDAASPPSTTMGWIAVAIMMVLYISSYLDRQILNLLIDDIRADLHATDVQMSLLQGLAFVLSFVICGIPIGWAVDRYPRRWIIFFGVMVWSAAAAAAGLSRTFGHMLLARLGVGAGEASLQPAAYSMLADIFPKDRLSVPVAVFSSGATIGMAISLIGGGLIVGWAKDQGAMSLPWFGALAPWQFVLLITAAPGFVLSFLVFLISEPPRGSREARAAAGGGVTLWAHLKQNSAVYFFHFTGFSLLCIVAQGWNAWKPTFLIRTLHWDVPTVGWVSGLVGLIGGVAGQLGSAALADFLFRRGVRDAHLRIYVAGCLFTAAGGVVAVWAANAGQFEVMVAAFLVIHAVNNFIAVAAASLQIVTPPHLRGQFSTFFLLVYNIVGYGLGPLFVAIFTEHVFKDPAQIGLSIAWNFGIFGVLGAIAFLFGLKPYRRALDRLEGRA